VADVFRCKWLTEHRLTFLINDEQPAIGFAAARSASGKSTAETANSVANTVEKIGCLANVSPLILTFSPLRGEGTGGG
jgi:hypothetical protein